MLVSPLLAWTQGQFSGDMMMNANFYHRDSARGAANIPHYDNMLSGADAWMNLNYAINDFEFAGRFDLFTNSNLHDPTVVFSQVGLGFLQARKRVGDLTVTAGHFYDQFGQGLVFRAYEERGLGIDNAILGVHLQYDLNDDWRVKAFTGKQRNRFEIMRPVLKGGNIDGIVKLGEHLQLNPGGVILNRTLDQQTMDIIVSEINGYPLEERFVPTYNMYGYSLYNTLMYKNLSWEVAYAGKSSEAIRDEVGRLLKNDGKVAFTNATYSRKGLGVTLQGRYVDHFSMRNSPNETGLRGPFNFLPTFSRQNSYMLTARYNAFPYELGEIGFQGDVVFTPKRGYTLIANVADIKDLDGQQLFREGYAEMRIHPAREWRIVTGAQYIEYNQEVYEFKPGVPLVQAYTGFMDANYRINRRHNIRAEVQYMHTRQDFGSWLYALIEYSISPRFTFSVSDMYNIKPTKTDDLHYPTLFASYRQGGTLFSLGYIKQVEGVVCTGGVCRWEPAFSGMRFSMSTNF